MKSILDKTYKHHLAMQHYCRMQSDVHVIDCYAVITADERSQAERQAVNSVCQGSAADLVKLAMIQLHQKVQQQLPGDSCKLLLQARHWLLKRSNTHLRGLDMHVCALQIGVAASDCPVLHVHHPHPYTCPWMSWPSHVCCTIVCGCMLLT